MTTTKNTTVHGVTYASVTEMHARMADLMRLNKELGESDGRVTELNALHEALSAGYVNRANAELALLKERDAKAAAWSAQQVAIAQRELMELKLWNTTPKPADHRVEYEEVNRGTVRRKTAYYKTEEGFLKALIRLHSKPSITVLHVD